WGGGSARRGARRHLRRAELDRDREASAAVVVAAPHRLHGKRAGELRWATISLLGPLGHARVTLRLREDAPVPASRAGTPRGLTSPGRPSESSRQIRSERASDDQTRA